jgi:hypothetical protein
MLRIRVNVMPEPGCYSLHDGGQPIQATLRHVYRGGVPFNAAKFDCPFKLR